MEFLSKKITSYFLAHQLISHNDAEMCCYAVYRRLSCVMVGSLLILLGSFEAGILPAICFTIAFLYLRESTGGYHAHNEVTCVILSCVVEFILLLLVQPVLNLPPSQWLLMVSGCICIVLIAPVNDDSIHMTDDEMKHNAHRSWFRLAILVCIILVLTFLDATHVVTALQLAIFGDAVSLVVAMLKNVYIKQGG